jgi:hypothetical protein
MPPGAGATLCGDGTSTDSEATVDRTGSRHDEGAGRTRSRSAGVVLVGTWLLALAAAGATPAAAQRAGEVTLRGAVLDADSKAPLFGVFVAPAASTRGVLTDSLGRFALPMERADQYALRLTQLGYHPLDITMPAEAERRTFVVGMKADPIEIEGLVVLTRRLTERATGRYGTPRVLDQGELLQSSFGTLLELTRNVVPFAQPCSPDADSLCVSGQGRKRPLQVCLDGRLISSASPELEAIDPRGLYLVASYPRVGRIQMYTRAFIARLLEAGEDLPPSTFECVGPGGFPGG